MLRQRITFSLIVSALFLSGLLLSPSKSVAQPFTFTAIDVPCAACPGGIARQTLLWGINSSGDIVGAYFDAVGKRHAFLLSNGQFTTIDPPIPNSISSVARGIGPGGDIVGSYTLSASSAPWGDPAYCPATGSPACIKGFLLHHGKFSTILAPGHPGAIPQSVTPDGTIYGCLHDFDLMGSMFGIAWNRFGDTTTLLAGGGALSDPSMSVPASMHIGATPGGNVIVGLYTDMMTSHSHGYLLQDGLFQTYDVPGSTFTWIFGINPKQQFIGTYKDTSGQQHGFLQLPDGSAPITIDYPNAVTSIAQGINPEGAIVGQYTDTKGVTHGFLATPSTGNN